MPNNTNTIDFLTNAENLTPVLEIVQHADAIRAKALSLFWTALLDCLRNKIPASMITEPLSWDADNLPEQAVGTYAGIALHVGGSQSRPQELNFRIEQTNQPKCFELYFGLHWKQQVPEKAAVDAKEPTLTALKAFQETNDFEFDKNPWWWGWKYLRSATLRDEFLLEFSRSPGLVTEIADAFWAYVGLARELVVKANDAMVLTPPPKS